MQQLFGNQNFCNPGYGQPDPYAAMRAPQMQTQRQQTPCELIRVTGMDGARAYQMPPNSAVALFDGGQDIFYVKTTDGAGFPTIRAFSFAPYEPAAQPQTEYVTRAEFEKLREEIISGKQSLRKSAKSDPAAE